MIGSPIRVTLCRLITQTGSLCCTNGRVSSRFFAGPSYPQQRLIQAGDELTTARAQAKTLDAADKTS